MELLDDPQTFNTLLNSKLTSGELFYHASDFGTGGKALYKDVVKEFWDFLEMDSHNAVIARSLNKYQKIAKHLMRGYELKIQTRETEIVTLVKSTQAIILSQIKMLNSVTVAKLSQYQRLFESSMMQLVLDYFTILKSEVDACKGKNSTDALEQEILMKQAVVLRDIRLFACHLLVESRGQLSLSMLGIDTPQFTRCVKAVTDNVNCTHCPSLTVDSLKASLRVKNVLKLQNLYLSNKLKAASDKVTNGKVKGLFCCLSIEQFYKFVAFGLNAQTLPYTTTNNLKSLAGDVFSTAWFCSAPPLGLPVNKEVARLQKVVGTAAKLCTAPAVQQADVSKGLIRFSRYSTLSILQEFSQDDIERGVFLSLCRVLIVHQKTIPTAIQTSDIMEATSLNYDALYSTLTEEYVLLQPNFVLPEFFMHVQFPDAFRSDASGTASRKDNRTIPDMFVSTPNPAVYSSPKYESAGVTSPTNGNSSTNSNGGRVVDTKLSALDLVMKFNCTEELLMQNQMNAVLNRRSGKPEVPASPKSPRVPEGSFSPASALAKKQNIVISLSEMVDDFTRKCTQVMREHLIEVSRLETSYRKTNAGGGIISDNVSVKSNNSGGDS